MSVLGHNPSETFLSLYANDIPNTKFTIYDTATLFGMKHQLFLDFYVEGKIWSYYLDIELLDLMEHGEFVLRQKCDKLLAQKETARICVKYWTGVDIE